MVYSYSVQQISNVACVQYRNIKNALEAVLMLQTDTRVRLHGGSNLRRVIYQLSDFGQAILFVSVFFLCEMEIIISICF